MARYRIRTAMLAIAGTGALFGLLRRYPAFTPSCIVVVIVMGPIATFAFFMWKRAGTGRWASPLEWYFGWLVLTSAAFGLVLPIVIWIVSLIKVASVQTQGP